MALDMRAAEYLWTEFGDFWTYWLAERFCGRFVDIEGQRVRVIDQLPKQELGAVLMALLSSDRARNGRTDTPDVLLDAVGESALEAQKLAALIVQPCFDLPGKGLVKEKRQRPGKKKHAWDWKRVMGLAFGPMGMSPESFWSLTLPEWIAYLGGYSQAEQIHMRKLAWLSRNQLIAAGVSPKDVTIGALLGEKEKRPKRTPIFDPETEKDRARKKIMERLRKNAENKGAAS